MSCFTKKNPNISHQKAEFSSLPSALLRHGESLSAHSRARLSGPCCTPREDAPVRSAANPQRPPAHTSLPSCLDGSREETAGKAHSQPYTHREPRVQTALCTLCNRAHGAHRAYSQPHSWDTASPTPRTQKPGSGQPPPGPAHRLSPRPALCCRARRRRAPVGSRSRCWSARWTRSPASSSRSSEARWRRPGCPRSPSRPPLTAAAPASSRRSLPAARHGPGLSTDTATITARAAFAPRLPLAHSLRPIAARRALPTPPAFIDSLGRPPSLPPLSPPLPQVSLSEPFPSSPSLPLFPPPASPLHLAVSPCSFLGRPVLTERARCSGPLGPFLQIALCTRFTYITEPQNHSSWEEPLGITQPNPSLQLLPAAIAQENVQVGFEYL